MERKKESGKLFDGIEEIIANVVLEDGVHIVKLKSTEKTNLYEVIGNTAVKTDEPLLETQLLEGMTVRIDLEQANQLIERYKEEAKKAWDRADMYKQKYEESEYEKDCMREDYEDIIRAKDKEITKLKAQLEWVKENPQNVNNYIQGSQYNIASLENSPQIPVQETTIENDDDVMKTCDAVADKISEEIPIVNEIEDIKICRFIVQDKIKDNTTYGKTEEERIDTYNRIIYRESQKRFPQFCKFLKSQNDCGNMSYEVYEQDYQTIYDHFVECYGDLHANYTSFRNACKGVMNGKSTGFYWNPHK